MALGADVHALDIMPQGQKSIGKVENLVNYRYVSATDENNLSYTPKNFIFT